MYQESLTKYNELEDSINKNKEFKRGSDEYDKMVSRIDKLESDVDLYKRILAKTEKDSKKEIDKKSGEISMLENENIKNLAEVRNLKEDIEVQI